MKNTSLLIRTANYSCHHTDRDLSGFRSARKCFGECFSWEGIKNNLAKNINLGLDLKGGSHLVMRVKTEEYLKRP